ncbi:MAG: hypothetical protein ABH875_03875, partial [Candidatus Omnitrophota bacterium]
MKREQQKDIKKKRSKAPLSNDTTLPADKKIILMSVILIIILGFIVYANSIGGQFIWDDNSLIRSNPYIR